MIFCFSATGNSMYVANQISKALGISVTNIQDLKDNDQVLINTEFIGIVTPTYFYGLPTIVTEFISKIQLKDGCKPYVFVVLTCGIATGNAIRVCAKLMQDKGIKLSAQYSVVMPDNYVILYRIGSDEEIKDKLEKADIEIDRVIENIRNRAIGDMNAHRGMVPALITPILYSMYKGGRKTYKFYVTEACIGCGLCEKICPAKAIKITDEKPMWVKDQCILCLGCLHRCPVEAIQYSKKTEKKGRYFNPNVKF